MGRHDARRDARWAMILAGGEGARLQPLTRRISGDERPKQFCSIVGPDSLLEQTRRRTALLVDPSRTLLILTRAHEAFYAPLLGKTTTATAVVQPLGRGTAAAILYGLVRVAAISPAAAVAIVPSDHYVADERRFMAYVAAGFASLDCHPELVVLLGIEPDSAETEYGWIEPGEPVPGSPLLRGRGFWEKPTPMLAARLLARGCLWNSFVVVGGVSTLLQLGVRTTRTPAPSARTACHPLADLQAANARRPRLFSFWPLFRLHREPRAPPQDRRTESAARPLSWYDSRRLDLPAEHPLDGHLVHGRRGAPSPPGDRPRCHPARSR